jgi:hypothetical protein
MISKYHRLVTFSILTLLSIYPSFGSAQNKYVVIPAIKKPEPYASLAESSPPNSAYTISDYFVEDNVTGLLWQRYVRVVGSWQEAWNYCQDSTAGRKRDWRLPSVQELISIADYGAVQPALNSDAFALPKDGSSWAETTAAREASFAHRVYVDYGGTSDIPKSSDGLYARCVRGKLLSYGNFVDNGDGTVLDLATNLTWQRSDDNISREWTVANDYCQGLNLAGKNDWHLPSIKQLQSIVDYRNSYPAISPDYFPGTDSQPYWSSTPAAWASGWTLIVNFGLGWIGANNMVGAPVFVRCVR